MIPAGPCPHYPYDVDAGEATARRSEPREEESESCCVIYLLEAVEEGEGKLTPPPASLTRGGAAVLECLMQAGRTYEPITVHLPLFR